MHIRNIKGGLIILAILFLIALLKGQSSEVPVSSHGGRFQIVINPNARVDTFLLDTDTGKTWRMEAPYPSGDPTTVWVGMESFDSQAALFKALIRTPPEYRKDK